MELRTYVRLKGQYITRCDVFIIKNLGHEFSDTLPVQVKDVSGNGLLFETAKVYPLGTFLRLEIDLPGWEKFREEYYKRDDVSSGQPLIVFAKVVRVEEIVEGQCYHVGVVIISIDAGDHKAFIALLKQIERREN